MKVLQTNNNLNFNSAELSSKEKENVISNIFNTESSPKYIKNIGNLISGNFEKIDGFDFRWSSLITNNPLLFEDIDYFRVKPFIENTCTEDEIQLYKDGKLRQLYASFENMIMCNLRYYDRIMNFCTLAFLHYVTINDEQYTKDLRKVPYLLNMTPTQIWCCALTSQQSTEFELMHGWGKQWILRNRTKDNKQSPIELTYSRLYKNPLFSKFIEYCAIRVGTKGFRETLISDKTSNRKLSQVCSKFTRTSTAVSEVQLDSIFEYSKSLNSIKIRLLSVLIDCMKILFNDDSTQYSVFVFTNDYYIFTSKFSLKVSKSERGVITKDYLANSYECFAAEEFLIPSVKHQIEWAKTKLPNQFEFDKKILVNILSNMLETGYKEIICINKMDINIYSKITFSGIFNHVKIIENFIIDNRIVKTEYKTLSKQNAAKFIVERGYYLFGVEKDITILMSLDEITQQDLINHYTNYTTSVYQHMFDVITANELSKNDIAEFLLTDKLNPAKLNNHNIIYTNTLLSSGTINEKQILNQGLQKQNKQLKNNRKGYWKVIE